MSVKHGILALLNRRSMHGYELGRELSDELGAGWAINYGQIYSTLERLARDGLVVQSETIVSAEAPDRKLYTVTPAGRTELRQWFLTADEHAESGREELYAKVMLALTGDIDLEDVIQAQRKGQLRRIGQLTEIKEQLDPELELGTVLQVDMFILKTEAVLKWLDSSEAKIRRSAATRPTGVAEVAGWSDSGVSSGIEREADHTGRERT